MARAANRPIPVARWRRLRAGLWGACRASAPSDGAVCPGCSDRALLTFEAAHRPGVTNRWLYVLIGVFCVSRTSSDFKDQLAPRVQLPGERRSWRLRLVSDFRGPR